MLTLFEKTISSRLLLGTAQYPTLQILLDAIAISETNIITVSLKKQASGNKDNQFWNYIKNLSCHILPNTAGCHHANDAVTTAEISREIFQTNWIKLEVIGDDYTLQPDPFELVKAAKQLIARGFAVFPYCTDDLILCQRLWDSGCKILMPWAAPIGSAKGIVNSYGLQILRARLPHATIIIDAGIGKPSHAAAAMELGCDGILLNSAIALAKDPVQMAAAFRDAIIAGRTGFNAGLLQERNKAYPSTSLIDTPFWHRETII